MPARTSKPAEYAYEGAQGVLAFERSLPQFVARSGADFPAWATKLANEISDPEMKALLQIALAEAWLDIPAGSTTIMSSTKQGSRMMMDMN